SGGGERLPALERAGRNRGGPVSPFASPGGGRLPKTARNQRSDGRGPLVAGVISLDVRGLCGGQLCSARAVPSCAIRIRGRGRLPASPLCDVPLRSPVPGAALRSCLGALRLVQWQEGLSVRPGPGGCAGRRNLPASHRGRRAPRCLGGREPPAAGPEAGRRPVLCRRPADRRVADVHRTRGGDPVVLAPVLSV